MRRPPVLVLALAACGRLGFEGTPRPDAATDGAAVDVAPAVCTHLFCDDLEDPLFKVWGGVQLDGTATAERDAGFGRTGGSLHAVSPVGSAIAYRYVDALPPSTTDAWVRAMLYVPSGQMLDIEAISIMDATRSQEIVIGLYDTTMDIHAHGIAADFNAPAAVAPKRDRWTCYELHVRFASPGIAELYVDGALAVTSTPDAIPAPGTSLGRVAVGVASKPTPIAVTLFVDDVAIDTTRVGCP